jgi:hypothetical protein
LIKKSLILNTKICLVYKLFALVIAVQIDYNLICTRNIAINLTSSGILPPSHNIWLFYHFRHIQKNVYKWKTKNNTFVKLLLLRIKIFTCSPKNTYIYLKVTQAKLISVINIIQNYPKRIKERRVIEEFTVVDRWEKCFELEVGSRALRWPTLKKGIRTCRKHYNVQVSINLRWKQKLE